MQHESTHEEYDKIPEGASFQSARVVVDIHERE